MDSKETRPVISPDPEKDSEKALNFFISQPLKLVDRFMKKLYADDEFYRSTRYALVADAKSLYLYGCARQVMKGGQVLDRELK